MTAAGAAIFLGAGAVAAPFLLDEAAGQGFVLVPPYVSEGQRAAAAAVVGSIAGSPPANPSQLELRALTPVRTTYHLTRVLKHLRAQRGGLPSAANFAKLTPADGDELARAFLGALKAGCGTEREPYRVVNFSGGIAGAAQALSGFQREACAEILDGGHPDGLTPLGERAVVLLKLQGDTEWFNGEYFDADALQRAVVRLASEMDGQGVSALGDPERYATIGPLEALGESLGWVGEQVSSGASSVAGAVAGAIGGGLAGIVFSTPGLIAIGGLLVWRFAR